MSWHRAAGVLAAFLLVVATGCGGDDRDSWTGQASITRAAGDTDPPATRGLGSQAMALDSSSRVELTVPAAYRIEIEGEVSEGGRTVPVDVGGWVLVTAPYDAVGASNDINVVDIGVKTDTSPLDGHSGALWFGTNTSIMGDLDLGVIPNGASVDIVSERVEADVIYADVIMELSRLNTLNLYNVDTADENGSGAQINNILVGTVSIRFAPDGSAIAGRIDVGGTSGMGGPTMSSEYHAALSGARY
jgi:hypothetical protein